MILVGMAMNCWSWFSEEGSEGGESKIKREGTHKTNKGLSVSLTRDEEGLSPVPTLKCSLGMLLKHTTRSATYPTHPHLY